MNKKHILIVDDEESILTVLKNSLKKLGPDYHVVTAKDGFTALDQIQEQSFDLIVTDYNMADMDGLELLEAIRYVEPKAPVIMITAYGNDVVEQETERLQAYRYLTKPLEIKYFREIVQEALGKTVQSGTSFFVLTDERYKQINQILEQLQKDISARCLFLTDVQGNIFVRSGDTAQVPIEEIASLLGGGIATFSEAGRRIDGNQKTINLAYREGEKEYLYALNIDQRFLLILVIDRGPYSSRLGTVWYYVQQAAMSLRKTLQNQTDDNGPSQVFEEQGVDQAFESELDKLFDDSLF